jgi:hypothetical protein
MVGEPGEHHQKEGKLCPVMLKLAKGDSYFSREWFREHAGLKGYFPDEGKAWPLMEKQRKANPIQVPGQSTRSGTSGRDTNRGRRDKKLSARSSRDAAPGTQAVESTQQALPNHFLYGPTQQAFPNHFSYGPTQQAFPNHFSYGPTQHAFPSPYSFGGVPQMQAPPPMQTASFPTSYAQNSGSFASGFGVPSKAGGRKKNHKSQALDQSSSGFSPNIPARPNVTPKGNPFKASSFAELGPPNPGKGSKPSALEEFENTVAEFERAEQDLQATNSGQDHAMTNSTELAPPAEASAGAASSVSDQIAALRAEVDDLRLRHDDLLLRYEQQGTLVRDNSQTIIVLKSILLRHNLAEFSELGGDSVQASGTQTAMSHPQETAGEREEIDYSDDDGLLDVHSPGASEAGGLGHMEVL